jgi:hypothetical protein
MTGSQSSRECDKSDGLDGSAPLTRQISNRHANGGRGRGGRVGELYLAEARCCRRQGVRCMMRWIMVRQSKRNAIGQPCTMLMCDV